MAETSSLGFADTGFRTGRKTLDRLSKLPWKEVSNELSSEGGQSASRLYNLLKDCAELGKWDLFKEAMQIIPDGCMENVIRGPYEGFYLFIKAVQNEGDDVLLSMIRRFPSLREHKDDDGDTALHMLCSIQDPSSLVSDCIDELCAFRLQATDMQNDDGKTPLHYAMGYSDVEVIEKITCSFPEMVSMQTNHSGVAPLYYLFCREEGSLLCSDTTRIIEAQLNACPSVTKCRSSSGGTPLHWYFSKFGIGHYGDIEALLKADPSATKCLDTEEETPIYNLWQKYRSSNHLYISNGPPEDYKRGSFGEFWCRVSMLLLAATKGCLSKPVMKSANDEYWREIDAIVELGRLVPFDIFILAVWEHFRHPEKPDIDGMLPLHYLAKGPVVWRSGKVERCLPISLTFGAFPKSVKMQDFKGRLPLHVASACKYHKDDESSIEERTIITQLISAYPHGAEVKTCFGSFPLHLAIKSGKHWSPDVKCILEAAPQVLSKPDPCSRLYPFMLAAVGEKTSENIVYELLKRDPSLVEMGILDRENEKYLERRICYMENKLRANENEINEMKSRQENCASSPTANPREKKRAKKI